MAEVGTISTPAEMIQGPGLSMSRMTWTTDGSGGAVSGIDVALRAGYLVAFKVVPVTSGGTQPTNLFDLTLLDADTLDLLNGRGANCVNTGPTLFTFDPPIPMGAGKVQPTLAAGGNSKVGEFVFVVDHTD